ncbi:MAG TPA: hypothetical protein VFA70_13420, partial [Dehalococcoidia bacterium]|nr:hypothetical protein [Dehalococcoidia bacterium]
GLHATADVMPRFLAMLLFVGIPGTHVSVGYTVLVFTVNASVTVSADIFHVLLHASLLRTMSGQEGWFTQLSQRVVNAGHVTVAVAAGVIPLLALTLYAVFLMVVRTIILGFCIATAPLCLATLAFDAGNRFVRWWLDLFLGALLTPVVFAVAIALSVTLAASIVSAAAVGPVLAVVVLCGGVWFAGRMVHTITWRHFSHGGAVTGFAAGVTAALAPLHRLANVGFMAEALGANASGHNGAVNFMKRIGLASQGFNPAVGMSAAMGAAGAGLLRAGAEPHVKTTGALPDIAAALGAAGKSAVAGGESAFSQAAFNAFARSHARWIGATTRDHPVSSLSFGDRAKLAWDRMPAGSQRAFADDFLSMWLGSIAGGGSEELQTAPAAAHG